MNSQIIQKEEMSSKENKIIELLNHIGDQEKHFNGLETQYRLLASTWLLACLGGIGFLLKDDKSISLDSTKFLLIGCIGFVGSIGILLLWILDMKVYHKLLNCVFIRGVMLEIEIPWLPKIRTDMLLSQETGDVTKNTALYYVFSTSLLQLISLGSFVANIGFNVIGIALLLFGIIIMALTVIFMLKSHTSSRVRKLYEKLRDPEFVDDIDKIVKSK